MKKSNGFTLIELLIVIAIIGLLSTMAVYAYNLARVEARDARRKADLKQIQKALELYYDNHGQYPSSGTSWQCSCTTGLCASGSTWQGVLQPLITEGLLHELPIDPVNKIIGSEYFCYEYAPPTFTSSWFCNGKRRTDYQYTLFFSVENSIFDLPRVTDGSGNNLSYYDYCVTGPEI
jgi:prepilin-type N-terminal cleavage/methylation domain-containing protein